MVFNDGSCPHSDCTHTCSHACLLRAKLLVIAISWCTQCRFRQIAFDIRISILQVDFALLIMACPTLLTVPISVHRICQCGTCPPHRLSTVLNIWHETTSATQSPGCNSYNTRTVVSRLIVASS